MLKEKTRKRDVTQNSDDGSSPKSMNNGEIPQKGGNEKKSVNTSKGWKLSVKTRTLLSLKFHKKILSRTLKMTTNYHSR